MVETQVLIVGAGPVGLTLALDLGQRGVRCVLIERNETSIQLPKMERCNARTMEIYRRLGVAEKIRDAGLPRDAPMDVFLAASMAEPALAHLACPSVAEAKAEIAAHNDGRPLEPYQLISQYTLEPLLRSFVETLPNVTVLFGCELETFIQDGDSVTAHVRTSNGADATIRTAYLVGCDGGSSTVRKQLGILLQGDGSIQKLRQALFHCPDLYERIPMGKGRHYHIVEGPVFPFIILQDSARHWTLHATASSDAEMAEIFRRSLGMPVEFDMLSVNEWTQHLLCAERYGEGRVFIAGDAAHLVIPTGGLGMNTGVGDAIDLSWKLAAMLTGWGGPQLLASYEQERRPIGLRNVKASHAAMSGRLSWRAAYHPDIRKNTPEGAAIRAEMASRFDVEQRKVTEILGIEAGYRYVGSPIVWRESGDGPDPDNPQYLPTSWPGARLPHVWLEHSVTTHGVVSSRSASTRHDPATTHERTALHDHLGSGFTLLRLGGTRVETTKLEQALRATGAPLVVLDLADESAREIYDFDLLLVRPDLHVVWRGNQIPDDAEAIATVATGRVAARDSESNRKTSN
jgi:2-polyprenyl-6-methoxyphenol hydroxylase-like FAD-dependent oxidoreductase